ncbi:MAG: TIGR02221 family CRISPR-associated protein [Deltaproteobacteria bacterium]|nr:TIGR02221 family CRISPR-associated protein [Deltaproteobacteria bacterium]
MKALSFLGLGISKLEIGSGYNETEYALEKSPNLLVKTDYFPRFMLEVFKPVSMMLFVTPEVKARRLAFFYNSLPEHFRRIVTPVDIPNGSSQAELWEVFEKLVGTVEEGETIVMDVTHAFRSLPMLALMAAQYLKAAKKVTIEGVYYGAYEARQENRSPVFDLSPFIALMDWTSALSLFNQTGNGTGIARILETAQNKCYTAGHALDRPTQLSRFGSYLEGIGRDLLHLKARTAMENIAKLPSALKDAEAEIANYAPPLAHVLERAVGGIIPLGHADKEQLNSACIDKQIQIVGWYIEHEHYVQALGLFREVLVNMACVALDVPEPFNYDQYRKSADAFLGYMAAKPEARNENMEEKMSQKTKKQVLEWADQQLSSTNKQWWEELGKCFAWQREKRNTLMHAEMNSKSENLKPVSLAQDIKSRIDVTAELLKTIPGSNSSS